MRHLYAYVFYNTKTSYAATSAYNDYKPEKQLRLSTIYIMSK